MEQFVVVVAGGRAVFAPYFCDFVVVFGECDGYGGVDEIADETELAVDESFLCCELLFFTLELGLEGGYFGD